MSTPRELADRFHRRWLHTHPFAASSDGIPGYDHLVPDDSEAGDESWRTEVKGLLAEAASISVSDLAPRDAVTLDCMREEAEQELAVLDSAPLEHTVTAMPFSEPASFLAVAARSVLVDVQAAEDYLARLEGSGPWIDQVTDRLRIGAAKGRVPVAPLVEQAIAWAESLLNQPVPSPLMAPQPPDGWAGSDTWADRRYALAAEVVRPALGRWVDALREVLPAARPPDQPGLCYIPGGDQDYARAVRVHTTMAVTPDQLYRIGLDEVAALEDQALSLGESLGLSGIEEVRGALRASCGVASPGEAIAAAVAAIRRAEALAPDFFPDPLPPPCEVSPMPPMVASSGVAPHYTPPRLDGGRPGTFWFNTERPTAGTGWDLEVVAFHEAVPGHHLQLSRVQMLSDLPELQRQRALTAFAEGWGLYAEQLADEVGLYSDVRSQLGSVSASLMRAARLVVDTGLHAFGWSREQAVEYLVEHVPMPAEFMASEADRYIVMPGQALAYLTGKLEIVRLRDQARSRLGARFSLPEFHSEVLDQGSLPLPVLDRSIGAWVDSLV